PERNELVSFVDGGQIDSNADRIKEILNGIETRNFLIWAVLKEREQALEALKSCPDAEGREALEAYFTGMLGDIDLLEQTDGAK
ncbi:MAG: hypothetical protein V2I48_13580, partial [Xanthomonadales bacterium]|nr:hypothetical protein [Xanthomonadales bacterium]